jgi:Gpi18-like mannosyltransferase
MTTCWETRLQLLAWSLLTRTVVIAAAVTLHFVHRSRHYYTYAIGHHVFGALGAWDGVWYGTVATRGYLLVPGRQSDPAFFPFYPIVLRLLHELGLPLLAAALIVSNLVFVFAILAFYELGTLLVREDVARASAILAAAFPAGFVFSMAYPESLLFAAVCVALVAVLRGRWMTSALVGGIAAVTRPEAVLYVIPVAAIVLERWRALPPGARAKAIASITAPVASLATFPFYLGWTLHNYHAWTWAERGWGRSFKVLGIEHAFTELGRIGPNAWLIRDVVLAVVYLACLGLALRANLHWSWGLAGLLIVLLPLTSGSFLSDSRFGLMALPAYWGLGVMARRGRLLWGLAALSLVLLAAATLTIPLTSP